jgi:plastocyanin
MTTPRHLRRLGVALVLVGSLLGFAACSDEAAEPPPIAEVAINTFMYRPDPLEIPVGTTVRFTNEDSTFHTVTAGTRNQPLTEVLDLRLAKGESVDWTFDESGTYDYYCGIHSGPGMTGQIVVS